MRNLMGPPTKLLSRMIELYSPTGEEKELALLLVEEMRSLGLTARTDGVGNVIGEYQREGPTFLLCGHMDTIPGNLPVKISENELYGRGAVDAKPALAAMICAVGFLVAHDFRGRLVVVGAVDEEGNSRGVKNLIDTKLQADYAVFGEPSGVSNITIAYKGSLQLLLTCRTKAGHSSAPWLFQNAAEEIFDLWKEIKKIRLPEEKPDSHFYSLSSALTEIRGGGPTSTVPSLCELRANFRLPPTIIPGRMIEEVMKTAETFRSSRPGVDVEVKVEDSSQGYEADRNSVLVKGMSWAIRDVRGIRPTLLRKTGTGDMNILGAALSIPMVTYGAGDSKLDHTEEEHVNLNEYLDSIEILQRGIVKTLELHNNSRNLPH